MTVKEFHKMNAASIEQYVNHKNGENFTLDYHAENVTMESSINWKRLQKYGDLTVNTVWARVNAQGQPVLVIEIQ